MHLKCDVCRASLVLPVAKEKKVTFWRAFDPLIDEVIFTVAPVNSQMNQLFAIRIHQRRVINSRVGINRPNHFEIKMNAKWALRHVALIAGPAPSRVQLRDRLHQSGCLPVLFGEASELLVLLCGGRRFDLLVIVQDGTSAWHQLAAVCSVLGIPALVLARKSGFEQGTEWLNDFPVSPLFDFAFVDCEDAELHQRMSRLMHHGEAHQFQISQVKETVFGNYEFREGQGSVLCRGSEIYLQPRQFQLALELFRNVGRVLDRNRLWALLWGTPFPSKGVRTLDVCVANVRKRLKLSPENGFALKSVYGRGYQLLTVTPLKAPAPATELAAAARMPAGWGTHSSLPPDRANSSPH